MMKKIIYSIIFCLSIFQTSLGAEDKNREEKISNNIYIGSCSLPINEEENKLFFSLLPSASEDFDISSFNNAIKVGEEIFRKKMGTDINIKEINKILLRFTSYAHTHGYICYDFYTQARISIYMDMIKYEDHPRIPPTSLIIHIFPESLKNELNQHLGIVEYEMSYHLSSHIQSYQMRQNLGDNISISSELYDIIESWDDSVEISQRKIIAKYIK